MAPLAVEQMVYTAAPTDREVDKGELNIRLTVLNKL